MNFRALISRLLLAVLVSLSTPQMRAATCVDTACVEIGGRLTSVDTTRSLLLNSLLGGLLGTSINLQVVDWQALTNANVNLLDLLQALQANASLGTPQAALDTSVDAVKIFNATATALQARGNTVAANAVAAIAARIGPGYMKLGDLLNICASCVSYAETQFNALDLVMGMVSVFNYDNMAYTPSPITINGSALGLGSLGTIKLYAQILEKPVIICRTPGSTRFYGAAIRVKLDLALPTVSLTAALAARLDLLGVLLGSIANLQADLTQLSVYASIARAEGFLQTVDALSQAVQVQAVPGMVDLFIGQIDDAVFFSHSHNNINTTTELTHANIGTLKFSALGFPITASVKAKAFAIGQAPNFQQLNFSGPYPQQQTVSTSTLFVDNLVTSLLNSLDLKIEVTSGLTGLGLLTSTVTALVDSTITTLKPLLVFVYKAALSPIVGPLLSSVLDPMLSLLGIKIGEAYVTVLGAARRCTYTVSGTVYSDANHNGFKDGSESGTNLPLYAKLVSESTPTGPALQAVAVNGATGAYSFSTVDAGLYRIVIDDNDSLPDVTPITALPSGWTAIEQSTFVRTGVAVTTDVPNQNFGFAYFTKLSGRVFLDAGTGPAGTGANDGVRNGSEAGIGGVTVRLLDAGGTALDTATTAGDGTYQLYISSSLPGGTALRVVETNFSDDLSSGGSAGNTGGMYQRSNDTVSFFFTSGTTYTGVDFGDVQSAQFSADGQKTGLPGTTVHFPHRFVAGSAGSVTFAVSHLSEPALNGWTGIVFLDANGNSQLDAGDTPVTGAATVIENQAIDLIVKVFIPTNAAYGMRNQTTVQATMTYTGAAPALVQTLSHVDLTIVGAEASAGLTLIKTVDKAAARPGDRVTYTVAFTNQSPNVLRNIVISDMTPSFTKFVSMQTGTNPPTLGAATAQSPTAGATGAIRWSFAGELASGASGSVIFVVEIDH